MEQHQVHCQLVKLSSRFMNALFTFILMALCVKVRSFSILNEIVVYRA